MSATEIPSQVRLLRFYYAATTIFVVFDYFLNINIRLAALEQAPAWRAIYYVFCFACLGLMCWRPGWSLWIATTESLITLSLLIINMALRIMIVSDEMIASGRGAVTLSEIINFMIVSGVTYIVYTRGAKAMSRRSLYP